MLSQAVHWMDIAATAVDGLLLLRVLGLRLNRLYLFITLGCVVGFFFDLVGLWLGADSPENGRVVIYSRFLYAFLYPAIAWDVFEEVKAQVGKIRRLQVSRLISGLVLALVFGLLVGASIDDTGSPEISPVLTVLALSLWVGSSVASLSFLWFMRRSIQIQKIETPKNTSVWLIFYMLVLFEELLASMYSISGPLLHRTVTDAVAIFFDVYSVAITAWCIAKLRGLPPGVTSASENAPL